ncbi:DEAD/DEAH box helicase [Janthinobacterium agaricidamnosum]|uniref:Helicase conserved C-terminal domain protein n=1 Tax=Janthinobacterium agaricidamnosum NBRC 102515 = DSM 9628 TaxID=1349767 RepID=W0UWL4_9BURK|nr:DEAD/DEAH box helicase [Janthinobacterium agaricidamnosum]CDG80754.1 helicase conserved C-terminal domain protein [Janthinobacterium agaricidamnosum NBRC 102515 = DSM 9628]
MNPPQLLEEFDALEQHEKMILALLAIVGEPVGKHAVFEHLQRANINQPDGRYFKLPVVLEVLQRLARLELISEVTGRGFSCGSRLRWPAMRAALDSHVFRDLGEAVESINPVRRNWDGYVELRSYRQGVARLRIALLRGDAPQQVVPLLTACMACYEAAQLHPLIDIFGRPFEPDMIARVHPLLQDEILAILLGNSQYEPPSAPQLREFCQQHLQRRVASGDTVVSSLRLTLAEDAILCGRLDDASGLLQGEDGGLAHMFASVIQLLRGEQMAALAGFEAALKLLRRESGKRKLCFAGIGGHLYVLALLRSTDAKLLKQAESYLELALRAQQNHDSVVYQQLSMLRQVRAGTMQANIIPTRNWETRMQPQMFQALLYYWLALPQLADHQVALRDMVRQADAAGFYLIAAQAANLLGQLGDLEQQSYAATHMARYGFVDMAPWFERQEAWQRQLSALINLQQQAPAEAAGNSARLVWMIAFDPRHGITEIEPREQKRDARGVWSKGRAMGLKRLHDDAPEIDFLSPQDVRAAGAIAPRMQYYSSAVRYEIEPDKAIVALIGHPLVFWMDAPENRVDLLPAEPELLIKKHGGQLWLSLQPAIPEHDCSVVVTKETPTRLRVVHILDEHRRIAAIVGASLAVPVHAEKQVLQAIRAISSLVTVQSDIGGGPDNAEQIAADARLHIHLLPYQQGLKMQILVRPLPGGGAYYAPGSGAESVFADLDGRPVQARRDLNAERAAQRQMTGSCRVLEEAEEEHGEWLLGQPSTSLQLLVELQELDPESIVIAWPEGESFRVSKRIDSQQLSMSIKSGKDWFAASGELQVDENKVLDLRALLDLMQNNKSRFVALGDNQFLALSDELHRRLSALAAFGESTGDGVRVHPLAAFALEELANDAGGIKADKLWKSHLARLQELENFVPQLPSTLQAELRDYQLAGFAWLARLAHWGVGACLADDMGLGKTLQALALILSRAPDGPTLVIAPTSVCMNWISEAARFAPTLNVTLFGAGDRGDTLAKVQPFDLVVASYGLLQQEAKLFADVKWHTIVLDEAQAIKNAATKRSQAVMALQGDFRMVASGTPLENHLGELWNLFRFINPGLLGSMDQFNLRFAGPIERAQDKRAEAGARLRLKRLIQPFILRRTKTQVLSELPPRTEIVLEVDLSPQETALYESLRREALEKLAMVEGPASKKAIQILAEIMKLRRACCNPQLVAPELGLASSKLTAFAELLSGLLENRHKVLVFSQFVDHLTLIRQHLDQHGIAYQYLDGATPMHERKVRVDAFQAGHGDVFLISLKAGGMGINLTAADYVIHMDPWWNPAVEDQASDRAHRMGQLRPVTIYRLVAKHTIEESIVDLHQHKRDLADSLLEGSDAAARMSAGDMLGMLQEGLKK